MLSGGGVPLLLVCLMLSAVVILVDVAAADELIAVRCQSACLHQLQIRHSEDAEMRRNLKHQIINMCKEDANCTACTEPCRDSFTTVSACRKKFCASNTSSTVTSCENSCDFVQKIFSEKPGACPAAQLPPQANECTASCHLDGDCAETQKCCSVGCSRKCLAPRPSVARLLPLPSKITVQERKRRRSAVVRWELRRLSSSQSNALSNLFVLQWRWGVHEETLTEWQTILIRNKPYAILKHLLSPGRFYQFRVAAVSTEGSLGFSTPSRLFKLSKEARAPGPPRLFLGVSRLSPAGLWSQTVQWTPPHSDLPIKSYQLSWWESTATAADAWEEAQRRRALFGQQQAKRSAYDDEDDDDKVDEFALGGFGKDTRRHSAILPSHHTSNDIEGLALDAVYFVEVHASVESTEGELHGEKGMLFIRTASLTPPSPTPRASFSPRGFTAPSSGYSGSSFSSAFSGPALLSSPAPTTPLPAPLVCRLDEYAAATCSWKPVHSTSLESTIGYRVVLSASALGLHNISVLPPQTPDVLFEALPSSTTYFVEVQPITSRGVGKLLSTSFSTSSSSSSSSSSSHEAKRFETEEDDYVPGEIVELPLESSSSTLSSLPGFVLFTASLLYRHWLR